MSHNVKLQAQIFLIGAITGPFVLIYGLRILTWLINGAGAAMRGGM